VSERERERVRAKERMSEGGKERETGMCVGRYRYPNRLISS